MILSTLPTLGLRFAVKLAVLLLLAGSAVWVAWHARRVMRVFQRFFEEEGSPIDLALFRIVLFATIFLSADPTFIDRYSRLPHELSMPPLGFGLVLRALPIEPELARWATLALRGACLFALIGLFTRSAAAVAGLLTFYVLGIPSCFGQVDHYQFLVWFALLLALSPCGDALSVDAIWRRHRSGEATPAPSVVYARPIRWVWLLMGVIYLFPGLWKLWISGKDWLFGDALISHMRRKWVELHWVPGVRPDNHRWLSRAAGVGAIAFELSFLPLVLFRRARPFVAIAGLAFHNLSDVLMGISFIRLQAMYASFLRVGRFAPRFLRRRELDTEKKPNVPRGQMRALDLAGGLFLSASLLMGVLLIEEGWPFACFPTFAWVARNTSTELEFVAISESGKAAPIDAWPLIQSLGTERWRPMSRKAASSSASLSALARWVGVHAPESKDAVRIDVYQVIWNTNPDRRSGGPIRRELLAEVPR